MAEFDVGPAAVVEAGGRVRASGDRILEVSSDIGSLSSAAGATGDPQAASAYSDMCAVWNRELFAIGGFVAGLGVSTTWAGQLYGATDNAIASLFSSGS